MSDTNPGTRIGSAHVKHATRIAQLEQMRLDRFRSLRWSVIDAARRDGMTWDLIAEALNMPRQSVMRTYRDHAPESATPDA